MKVYKESNNGCAVSGIDFCCPEMAEDILLGTVKTTPWTDHPLVFLVKGYYLSHCGHCGAKIEGDAVRKIN